MNYSIEEFKSALQLLTPELWLVAGIVVCALWNQFFSQARAWTPGWALLALLGGGVTLSQQIFVSGPPLFGGMFTIDRLTVLFGVLACAVSFIVVLMSIGYEHHFGQNRGEFYAILLTATLAVMLLAGTTELVLLFVALETLSICCVLLSGMLKKDVRSNEASLKYLLSTAATTATLLYGLSFLYGLSGSTYYTQIHEALAPLAQSYTLIIIFAMVLVLSGVGFKLSTVPFHMWTPDVYEGAPTPVTAFLSIGSKAGGFIIAIRLLTFVFAPFVMDWTLIVGLLAIFSMIMGNLIALAQNSFKRMLAYSSIAHVGYILIGLVSSRPEGLAAMIFYIIVYGLMNLGAFAAAILFTNETGSDDINDYAGLIRKRPWLAIALSVCLLNLAGLPLPPAGFFAKVFVFWSGVQMFQQPLGWTLVVVALVTSVPAIYYYTRVVIKMIVRDPSDKVMALQPSRRAAPSPQLAPELALGLCVIGIFVGSVMVNPLMSLSRESASPVVRPPALGILPGGLQ